MEPEWIKEVRKNLARSEKASLFADEVLFFPVMKGRKEKNRIVKEANIKLAFIDMDTRQPVAKVVLSYLTARSLCEGLGRQLQQIEKELKSKEFGKERVKPKIPDTRYIG